MRFTVRRPPTGEVSPCCHRPSGGDVACSIDVGVASPGSAGLALEDRLALAVFRCDVPARRATLRRIRSRDLLYPAVSLVLQSCGELTPTTSKYCAVESSFLSDSHAGFLSGAARGPGHRPHVKSLDPDHVEPLREVSGGRFHPVPKPIPFAGFQLRDRPFRPLAAMRIALGPRKLPLQHPQPLRFTRGETRCVQQLAGRKRRGHSHTPIDADYAPIARTGDRIRDVGKRDMPAVSSITGNPVGLDTVWHRPRHAKPDPPDLGHPDPTEAAIQSFDVLGSQADLPKPFVHARFAPPRATVRAGEEVSHSLRVIPQRLLLHRLTPGAKPRVLRAGLGQLCALLPVAGSHPARLPVPLLLYRQIPHIPRIPTVLQQLLLLLRGGQQSEPRHIRKVTTTTDIPSQSARVPRDRHSPWTDFQGFSQRRLR